MHRYRPDTHRYAQICTYIDPIHTDTSRYLRIWTDMNRYTHIPRYIQYLYGYRSDIYVYVPGVHRCALIYTDIHMFLYQSPCTIWDYSLRNEGQKGSMLWAWHLWQGWRAGIGQPPLLHQFLGHVIAPAIDHVIAPAWPGPPGYCGYISFVACDSAKTLATPSQLNCMHCLPCCFA
jgi:hypothetical protein